LAAAAAFSKDEPTEHSGSSDNTHDDALPPFVDASPRLFGIADIA
jgi:hypothetical protein